MGKPHTVFYLISFVAVLLAIWFFILSVSEKQGFLSNDISFTYGTVSLVFFSVFTVLFTYASKIKKK